VYVNRLAGKNADSLTRASALHFARLAAAGNELCDYGVVDWDEALPITVIERLYRAHVARQANPSRPIRDARLPATEILAHIGSGDIQVSTDGSNPDNLDAYLWTYGGKRFAMIKSHALSRYISGEPKAAAKALKAEGAVKSSGNTPYFQNRQDSHGTRYFRAAVSELRRIAFEG
jgi:hypothetical protein